MSDELLAPDRVAPACASPRRFSRVVGFDDAPFSREHRGDVAVVGVVMTGARVDGVLRSHIRRDGVNATRQLAAAISGGRFADQVQAVLLQGIALGGFNVVDIHALAADLGLPVLVVARRQPDLEAVRAALLERVPGGRRKWRVLRRAGLMEPCGAVWVQRAGLSRPEAEGLLATFTLHGKVPEPLRVAHLVAGAWGRGESRGRA